MTDISTMVCTYGATTYRVTIDMTKSQYRGMLPSENDLKYFPFYSTVDDLAVKDVAEQLSRQLEGRRDRIKASVLLALIQQNIKYVSDEERFGTDVWETPAYTLEERMADCDGMASLYVSLAYNMGIDAVAVLIEGHMFPAICVPGVFGRAYRYGFKDYVHVETTDQMPVIGRYWDQNVSYYTASPEVPNDEFKRMLVPKEQFIIQ